MNQKQNGTQPVQAGGFLAVDEASGTPIAWPRHEAFYNLDSGPLGNIPESQARELVRTAFHNWTTQPGVGLTVREGQPVHDRDGKPVDVTSSNIEQVLNYSLRDLVESDTYPLPDGQSPIIFDNDGKLLEMLYGPNSGVIGLAGFEVVQTKPPFQAVEGIAFLNGLFTDGNPDNSLGVEYSAAQFQGIVTHEMGHFLGLDHSQVNGPSVVFDRDIFGFGKAPADSIETMYPFSKPETGIASGTPARDDAVALARLYPAPDFASQTGFISGRVQQPDGATILQGVNVVARNLAAPFDDAISQVSGARYRPPFFSSALTSKPPGPAALEGLYELPGLTPQATYVVAIEPNAGGGFVPPLTLGYQGEFFSGSQESGNPELDPPALRAELKLAPGQVLEDINVTLNASSGKSLLVFPRTAVVGAEMTTVSITVGIPSQAPAGGVKVTLQSRNPNIFEDTEVLIPAGKTAVPVSVKRKGPGAAGFNVMADGYMTATFVAGAAQAQPALLPVPPSTPVGGRLAVGEIVQRAELPRFLSRIRVFDVNSGVPASRGAVLATLPAIQAPSLSEGRLTQLAYSLDGKTLYVGQGFTGSSLYLTLPQSGTGNSVLSPQSSSVLESVFSPEVVFSPEFSAPSPFLPVRSAVIWRLTDADGDGVAETIDFFETGTADIQDLAVTSTSTGEVLLVASNYASAPEFFSQPRGVVAPLRPAIMAFRDSNRDGKVDGDAPQAVISTEQLAARDVNELSGGMAIDTRDRLLLTVRNILKNQTGILVATDTDADGLADRLELTPYLFTSTISPVSGLARLRVRDFDNGVFFSGIGVQDLRFDQLGGGLYNISDTDLNGQADGVVPVAQELGLTAVSPNLTNSGLEFGPTGQVFTVSVFPGFRAGPLTVPQYAVYTFQLKAGELVRPTVFALGPDPVVGLVDEAADRIGFLTGLARGIATNKFAPVITTVTFKKKDATCVGRRFRTGLTCTVNGNLLDAAAFQVTPTGITFPNGKKSFPKGKSRLKVTNPDGQTGEFQVVR
ncbi:MAG: hypothetical protein K1Y36_22830 [Blastocatellia bacterium]|nr:hypothetical protein [Blastocatellia bacterium]